MKQRTPPLSRTAIIRAAIGIVDADGLENLSIRRLAQHLDVSPMAIYKHIPSKEKLLELSADTVASEVRVAEEERDWQDAMRKTFASLRDVCLRHPNFVSLIGGMNTTTVLDFMEFCLNALKSSGMSQGKSENAYSALIAFTLGHISYEIQSKVSDKEHRSQGLASRNTKQRPNLNMAARRSTWDAESSFWFGLNIILGGLAGSINQP